MKKTTLFLTMLLSSQISFALTCSGNITKVETLYTGIVRVLSTSGAPQKSYICSINGNWKNISTDTCKAWISSAQIAHTSGKKLDVVYSDTSATSCSDLPVNSASVAPYSVGIR